MTMQSIGGMGDRKRIPRVEIEYDVNLFGEEKQVQLPFVMAVMADLSGQPAEALPQVADRKFLEIDVDNFHERLKAIKPCVALRVPNALIGEGELSVEMSFEDMDDFSPESVARNVGALNDLLETRSQLLVELDPRHDGTGEDGYVPIGAGPDLPRPDIVPADVPATIQRRITEIDKQLSQQISLILHHEDFQKLESAWRGLHYLVTNTETDEMLKIRVLNISKENLGDTLREFEGTCWDRSPIFRKLYEDEYGQLGGEPYGCLVGDYYFDHGAPDVALLSEIARIAAAMHTPFLAGVSPSTFLMDSWRELANPTELNEILCSDAHAAWRCLREAESARYVALCLPRFLARQPYGAVGDPVEEFDFEEDIEVDDESKYTWANSAYAMATNINRSFKLYGWCSRILGAKFGGSVDGLPMHSFPTDDGGVNLRCPTEIEIDECREGELARNGFMPLSYQKNLDCAVFIEAPGLQLPAEHDEPAAAVNAPLTARLPYLLITGRFAHYIKCMVRDSFGSFSDRADLQHRLQVWIAQYVDEDPIHSDESTKARKPLVSAEVVVESAGHGAGYYNVEFSLDPQYQIEPSTVSLRLRLPAVGSD
ncbi:MAG: type VI secretion system contractile sheath large subunit [Gammaproteobacteria bacterium]|nr:type VI secretion system contractile sheath large subunit [Gammaproteobacteria bacterium]